jgi:hypothetical protein
MSARETASIREQPGLLPPPLAQAREVAVDALDVGGHAGLVAAQVGAKLQVLFGGEVREGAAAVGHVGHAQAHDVLGGLAVDALAARTARTKETDFALRCRHHRAQRAQRRRLAGAVGAKQRRDRPLVDREREAVQHPGRAVARVQVAHLEQRCRHPRASALRGSVAAPVAPVAPR